jgi:1,4-alpha-glucan branching enzyme
VLGVPHPGPYVELVNTDSTYYGGSDVGNRGQVIATATQANGQPASMRVVLPPLAAVVFALEE